MVYLLNTLFVNFRLIKVMNFNGNTLLPFQEAGVDWLTSDYGPPHRYLADDCGLGKTVQLVAACIKVNAPSVLVITLGTVGVRETWARTFVDWGFCSENDIHIVYKTTEIIPLHSKRVIVVSDNAMIAPIIHKQLKSKYWGVIIGDEAHIYKTINSDRSIKFLGPQGLIQKSFYKWLASASIMPNRPVETFPSIRSLYPSCIAPYTELESFGLRFCAGYSEFNGYGVEWYFDGASNIEDFKERIKPFVLRRELRDVFPDIPPMLGRTVYINLGELGFNKHNTPLGTLQRLIGEAKIPQVSEYIHQWRVANPGKKLIVFAYHREVLQQLYENLCGYVNAHLIYGGLTKRQKDATLDLFINSKYQDVLFLQITCGGTALNGLQYACHNMLFAEPDWSPGKVNQAIGRILRYGQQEVTYVTEIIAENTLDETKIGSCYTKQAVINKIFDKSILVTEKKQMDPNQINRALDLFERAIEIAETIIDNATANAGNDQAAAGGTVVGTGGKTRTRRTKAQIEADNAALAARQYQQPQGAVPTGVATTPNAGFVPGVQPLGVPVQTPPPPIQQQPATNGQPVTWEQVQISASNALARVKTQMDPMNPQNATGAANALMSLQVKNILGAPGAFNDIQGHPDKWLFAIQTFDSTNHQPQQQQPAFAGQAVGSGPVGF